MRKYQERWESGNEKFHYLGEFPSDVGCHKGCYFIISGVLLGGLWNSTRLLVHGHDRLSNVIHLVLLKNTLCKYS